MEMMMEVMNKEDYGGAKSKFRFYLEVQIPIELATRVRVKRVEESSRVRQPSVSHSISARDLISAMS